MILSNSAEVEARLIKLQSVGLATVIFLFVFGVIRIECSLLFVCNVFYLAQSESLE